MNTETRPASVPISSLRAAAMRAVSPYKETEVKEDSPLLEAYNVASSVQSVALDKVDRVNTYTVYELESKAVSPNKETLRPNDSSGIGADGVIFVCSVQETVTPSEASNLLNTYTAPALVPFSLSWKDPTSAVSPYKETLAPKLPQVSAEGSDA